LAVPDKAMGEVAFAVALGLVALGVYGVTATNNMLRMLLSIEVIFNGVLLMLISLLAFDAVMATVVAVILVSVVAAEVIVTVAILAGFYRQAKTFETGSLEEEGV